MVAVIKDSILSYGQVCEAFDLLIMGRGYLA